MKDDRKAPVAGISISGPGYHFNTHFASEASADAAYAKEVESAKASFKGACVIDASPIVGNLLQAVCLRNVKVNGKPGKFAIKITRYRIDEQQAQSYMRDRLYSCLD